MTEYYVPPPFDDFEDQQGPPKETEEAEDETFRFGFKLADEETDEDNFDEILAEKHSDLADPSLFTSTEFMQEGTMLTNIEDYAKRIRESSDNYATRVKNEANLIKSEIELELAKAVLKRREAEEEAASIIKTAQNTRDQIVSKAYEEGFQQGQQEGFQAFQEQNETNTTNLFNLIQELEYLRSILIQQYEEQIVDLSLLIAEKVTHQVLQEKRSLVVDMLQDAMHYFEGLGNIRIRIHPTEYEFVTAHKAELGAYLDEDQVLKIVPDASADPASAEIECDLSVVNMELKNQFEEIRKKLQNCAEDRKALFTQALYAENGNTH